MTDFENSGTGILGVIEVLNRTGQVIQRLPWDGRNLRIGRAYDNDMIVDDHYVCPHHLELAQDSGRLLARDLGSVNGSYHQFGRTPFKTMEITDGSTIQFGHSVLRYHATGSAVAPAWRDAARHGVLASLGKASVLALAATLSISAMTAESLLVSPDEPGILSLAGELPYPLIVVLLWSGFWALLNRVVAHRANFNVHLTIAFLATAALFLFEQLALLTAFALGWNAIANQLDYLVQSAVLAIAIYSHLRYAMPGGAARQAMVAAAVALILFGTPQIGNLVERSGYSSLPYLDPLLWPPEFQLVPGESVDEFFDQSAVLREELDQIEVPR